MCKWDRVFTDESYYDEKTLPKIFLCVSLTLNCDCKWNKHEKTRQKQTNTHNKKMFVFLCTKYTTSSSRKHRECTHNATLKWVQALIVPVVRVSHHMHSQKAPINANVITLNGCSYMRANEREW